MKSTTKDNNAKFYIKITKDGPYLVYGISNINQEIIVPDDDGESWIYEKGKKFACQSNPTALCRCGHSNEKPFCDGSHSKVQWNPKETASKENVLNNSTVAKSDTFTLYDNQELCSYARFCDAYGGVWSLVKHNSHNANNGVIEHEIAHCPSGRLMLYNNKEGYFYEPKFDPSISLIEDSIIKISGPLWVKGGIRIESSDGTNYEIRNRVTLCRCGKSKNKPFCDSSHIFSNFNDHLMKEEEEKEKIKTEMLIEEEVYQ